MKQNFWSLAQATLLGSYILTAILLIPVASAGAENTTLAVEPTIYFTTTSSARILRIDGQGQNETEILGPLPLQRMAYDSTSQKVYGATKQGAIRRMNPDGTGLETLLTGLDDPIELQLDPVNGKMYWFHRRGASIQRSNLDGSALETIVPSGEVSGGASLGLDSARGKLYWIRDDEEIRRANLDGSSVETIIPGQSFNELLCLVLDRTNQKLYWVNDGGTGSNFIGRSNLDGSNIQEIVALNNFPDVSCPLIDTAAGLIYWGDADDGAIKSANLDGSNVQTHIPVLDSPEQLVLDSGGKLYWAERAGGPRAIRRADANGNNIETLVMGLSQVFNAGPLFLVLDNVQKLIWNNQSVQIATANLDGSDASMLFQAPAYTYGIDLDAQNGQLYWANSGAIARANVDGTGFETVVSNLNAANAVALDPAGSKLYWTDGGLGRVQRANLDGSDLETLYTYSNRPDSMNGLAVDDANGKLYWSDNKFIGGVYVGTLWRSKLDGSEAEAYVPGLGDVRGIAINQAGTVVYAIDAAGEKVQRISLSDKSVTNLVTGAQALGIDIALDEGRGHLYWTALSDGGVIRRANIDGSGVTNIYVGAENPFRLTLPRSKASGIFSDGFEDIL